jgi:hypothetical protein
MALVAFNPSVLLTAWPWQTAVVAQTTTTIAPGPVIELRGSGAAVLVIAVGLALVIMWGVPMWVDARRAYRLRQRAVDLVGGRLLDAAEKNGLTVTELRELLGTIGEPATGQRGLSRALMAFTIITVVGVALLALLLSSAADAGDLRKTVITSLLTLLGTIVGFYFGTRAAETGVELAAPPAAPPPAPPPAPPAAPPAAGMGGAEAAAAAAGAGAEAGGAETGGGAEGGAAPTAEEDPAEQLEAGLGDLGGPDEVAALDRQVAAEHGEPAETEVEDEPLHEDDVLPEDEKGGV